MLIAQVLVLVVWVRRRRLPTGTVNATTVRLNFWFSAAVRIGIVSLVVGTAALSSAGQLDWLTLLGGGMGLSAWVMVIVLVRRYSPTTLIYDSDKPGI